VGFHAQLRVQSPGGPGGGLMTVLFFEIFWRVTFFSRRRGEFVAMTQQWVRKEFWGKFMAGGGTIGYLHHLINKVVFRSEKD